MTRIRKHKQCPFCRKKVIDIDYKDGSALARYISNWAKIKSRKETGACAGHQRRLAEAIKRARELALLPYVQR